MIMESAWGCGACADTGCFSTRSADPPLPSKIADNITIRDMQIPPSPSSEVVENVCICFRTFQDEKKCNKGMFFFLMFKKKNFVRFKKNCGYVSGDF